MPQVSIDRAKANLHQQFDVGVIQKHIMYSVKCIGTIFVVDTASCQKTHNVFGDKKGKAATRERGKITCLAHSSASAASKITVLCHFVV